MSLKNIFYYVKQLSSTINAGLPINRALEVLTRTAPTRQLRAVSAAVNRSIDSGSTLTQAFEKYGRSLPHFFTRMIMLGENTGRLEQVTSSLSSYYEQRYEISRAVKRELYPILIYFSVLMLLIGFIQWLLGGIAALQAYMDALAWALLVAVPLWAAYYFSPGFRNAMRSALLYIPFVNRLVIKLCLSRFCEGMRLAYETGLDVCSAIQLSAETSGNPAFRKRAQRASEHVRNGSSISESLEKTGVFSFEAIQMFIVGEETGKLHETMEHVSRFAREEALTTFRTTMILAVRVAYLLGILYVGYMVVLFWQRIYGGMGL